MIAKVTGNLIGANVAMDEIRTPMKVFKEARARGDKETMDRAMGYVGSLNDDAWDYKKKADEGIKEEAVEAKEKERLEKEELANRIKESFDEVEKALTEASDNPAADNEELKPEAGSEQESSEIGEENKDNIDAPVTYTKTGAVVGMDTDFEISMSV